jgi:hypothetical protein
MLTRWQFGSELYWNENELFITTSSGGSATSELLGVRKVPIIRGILMAAGAQDYVVLQPQTTVYHFAGTALEHDSVMGSVPMLVPVSETLYFVRNQGRNGRTVWRWENGRLAAVSGPAASDAIKRSAEILDRDEEDEQPNTPVGWHHSYIGTRGKTMKVALRSGMATILVEPTSAARENAIAASGRVTLSAPSLTAPVELVGPATGAVRSISKSEFRAMKAQGSPLRRTGELRRTGVLAEYFLLLLLPFSPLFISILNLLTLKSKLLANLPTDATFPNALPEQFPALDRARLDSLTRELENLGFAPVIDFTMISGMAMQIPAFARLFIKPEAGCFAEINQVFPPRKQPVELAVSFFTRFHGGWQAGTGRRKPNAGSWIMRLPRSVWQSKPELDVRSLLQAHQQLCAQMVSDLGLTAQPARTPEDYFRGVREPMVQRREVVRRKWLPIILLEFYWFKARPQMEWKGDWAKEAVNRTSAFATSSSARA